MGHCPGAAGLHRQARLGTVEGLDLALLVNGEDDRVGRRIDIKTDDVLEFLCKLRVIRQLEGADAVRCKLVGFQDALHRPQAHPRRLGQHATGPMGRRAGRRPKRKVYHPPYGRGRQRLLSRLARLVTRQPRDAFRHEPGLPAPYHGLRLARAAHNLGSATTVGSGEDNIGAPHMFLRRAAVPDNRLKAAAIGGCHRHDNSCSHAESLNCFERFGNHLNESDH